MTIKLSCIPLFSNLVRISDLIRGGEMITGDKPYKKRTNINGNVLVQLKE